MSDIFIHELDLPMVAKAVTLPDENGDFTIIVNANLSDEAKRIALQHEMSHIKHDHFYKELGVAFEEREARSEERQSKVYSWNASMI